jgi:hypothetical protein
MAWYWWVLLLFVIVCIYKYVKIARRTERLMTKYGDSDLVDRIMNQEIWQGQTEEQLRDSLGKPEDIEEKVMKTKTKEIWKYDETGKNRYALKVTLENGQVAGWDRK